MNKAIHGAIRRDLQRFLDALERFPAGDHERAGQLARAWANLDHQLTHHHEGEHEIAWPALVAVGVSPDVLTRMDTEHDAMAAAKRDAAMAMAALETSASAEDAAGAQAAFQRLHDVTVGHLDHEESELEPVYLDKKDTPEIKDMGAKFGRAQSVPAAGRFFAWVSDGASDAELAGIRASVPGPVLLLLSGIFGRGYRRDIAPVWHVD